MSDKLRALTVRLAASLPKGSPERGQLLQLLRTGMEHATPEAKAEYLKKHPGADPANHTVQGEGDDAKGESKDDKGKDKGKGKGKSKSIKDSKGNEHHLISGAGGNTVFMGSHTVGHIKGHNQPGKGSVFSKGVDIGALVDTVSKDVPAKFFAEGGGIHTIKVPGVGRDLVKKVSDIREKYPDAQEIEIEKQEGVVMEDGPDGKKVPKKGEDGKPIPNMVKVKAFILPDDDEGGDWTKTDQMNVIMRPANPNFLPDEVKNDEEMKESLDAKKGFAVLTAFPGNPDVPQASKWGDDWAVIVPNGGKGADEDVQKALKGKGKKAGLRGRVIRLAASLPKGSPERTALLAALREVEVGELKLAIEAAQGAATLSGVGTIPQVAQALTRLLLPKLSGLSTRSVRKPTSKVKGFSFHWSNAQAAWDVITATPDMLDYVDGADFILWCPLTTLSPLGRPWSLTEMKYVAKALGNHPGYGSSMEGGQRWASGGEVGPYIRFNNRLWVNKYGQKMRTVSQSLDGTPRWHRVRLVDKQGRPLKTEVQVTWVKPGELRVYENHRRQPVYKYEDVGMYSPPVTVKDIEPAPPEAKTLAKQVAKVLKSEGHGADEARGFAADVAEDVNFHSLARILGGNRIETAASVSAVSMALDFGVFGAGWFGIYLAQEFKDSATMKVILDLMLEETAAWKKQELAEK